MFWLECSFSMNSEKISLEDLSKYFNGFRGCFIMLNNADNEYVIYNKQRTEKRMSPCSTFKIVNSLIGLESKVVKDENSTFKWDGTQYPIVTWNKDHSLATAVSNSVVWYFKQLASQVGKERMQLYLDKINYGNKDISGGITRFWLMSSLKISPREQVEMLKRFYTYQLPFSPKNVDIVKKILVLAKEKGAVLSGKTGTGVIGKKGNGWFVGYLELDNKVFFFATNIEGEVGVSGAKAKEISFQILKDKQLFDRNLH